MTKREIKKILSGVERARAKSIKLRQDAESLRVEAQKALDRLAKDSCPFKRGKMFKAAARNVWIKLYTVNGTQMKYGAVGNEYSSAPYVMECHRCNVNGVIEKEKFIFVYGTEICTEWLPCE
jgi:hypothetical protein